MSPKYAFLFALCSIIWGTTWFVIKFQIGAMDVAASVFYRFLIAGIVMLGLAFLTKRRQLHQTLENHMLFLGQGLFNFCLNYILTYQAEKNLNSAYIALTFTLLIYFNMAGLRFWFKKSISWRVVFGAIIGGLGLSIIFYEELSSLKNFGKKEFVSILLGIIATMFASIGNMFGYQNHLRKTPVLVFTSYGMIYGALCSLIISLFLGESITPPSSLSFWGPLLYLSVAGTVIAFWSYQTLVGKFGADRAAFTSLISPIIAVVVSLLYENLVVGVPLFVGVLCCLLGNYLSLKRS